MENQSLLSMIYSDERWILGKPTDFDNLFCELIKDARLEFTLDQLVTPRIIKRERLQLRFLEISRAPSHMNSGSRLYLFKDNLGYLLVLHASLRFDTFTFLTWAWTSSKSATSSFICVAMVVWFSLPVTVSSPPMDHCSFPSVHLLCVAFVPYWPESSRYCSLAYINGMHFNAILYLQTWRSQ